MDEKVISEDPSPLLLYVSPFKLPFLHRAETRYDPPSLSLQSTTLPFWILFKAPNVPPAAPAHFTIKSNLSTAEPSHVPGRSEACAEKEQAGILLQMPSAEQFCQPCREYGKPFIYLLDFLHAVLHLATIWRLRVVDNMHVDIIDHDGANSADEGKSGSSRGSARCGMEWTLKCWHDRIWSSFCDRVR